VTIGDKIKERRTEMGFSQQQLADMLGSARQTVTRYEKGEREPSFSVLYKIAEALDCTAAYFLAPPQEVAQDV